MHQYRLYSYYEQGDSGGKIYPLSPAIAFYDEILLLRYSEVKTL